MPYINIPKPTGSNYSKVSKSLTDYPQYGSAIYGLSKYGITNDYTNIPKPTGASTTAAVGQYMGFGAFTYVGGEQIGVNPWTKVAKPN